MSLVLVTNYRFCAQVSRIFRSSPSSHFRRQIHSVSGAESKAGTLSSSQNALKTPALLNAKVQKVIITQTNTANFYRIICLLMGF